MQLFLDSSANKIKEARNIYQLDIKQLRTPLTRYRKWGGQWGLDNGAYSGLDVDTWSRMVDDANEDEDCVFVVVPDCVGDRAATNQMWNKYKEQVWHSKRCYVLQDGDEPLPAWDEFSAMFLGGTDDFRIRPSTYEILKEAKARGKWVHIGRVNTPRNITRWYDLADSFDGSGIARFSHMLEAAASSLKELATTTQKQLTDY